MKLNLLIVSIDIKLILVLELNFILHSLDFDLNLDIPFINLD